MNGKRQARHLVIFARRPRYGVGKRRLAAEVGELAAWRFQRSALSTLIRELTRDPRWKTWLAITPDRPMDWVRGACPVGQGSGDLGKRLSRVAKRLPIGPVVILGSDAPQVKRHDIAAAFKAIGRSDAVFGPSVDGGYWLVGLSIRRRTAPPFENVRWSTPDALKDTVANLRRRPIKFLRTLEDVDDGASLHRLQSRQPRPLLTVSTVA
jgi:rSAM/selenodomain-associated transferase 1